MELEYLKNVTEEVVTQIAYKHGFKSPRWEFSAAAKKADNFIGQLFRCRVTDEDNFKKQLHLVVKLPPADKQRREILRVEKYFSKETFMYGTVLPALTNCYIKKNLLPKDALFPCTARTYALIHKEDEMLIVMEDMMEKGFVMMNKHVGLDENHCRFCLKEVARIHAASLALQRDDPKAHESLTADLKENIFAREELHEHFARAIDKFRNVVDGHFPLGSPVRTKIEAFLLNYNKNMQKMVSANSTLSCITHGDLWVNNILFKHKKGTDTVEDVCFLDLQVARYCSPVTDIWYLLALCTRQPTRKAYKDLIECYYESLCSFLKDLGHDPEDIVPWNLFQRELREYGAYGWAISIIVLPAILLAEEDWDEVDRQWKENDLENIKLPAQAANRFIELVEDAEELGLLWD